MPIFELKFNLKKIKRQYDWKSWKDYDLINFCQTFWFEGAKSWEIYTCNSWVTTNHDLRPNCASDQRVEENRPPFKKMGICFFNFLIWGRFQPKMVNLCHVTISCIIFSWFGPLKIKISENNYMVIALLAFLTT